jgi:hypothetical protein
LWVTAFYKSWRIYRHGRLDPALYFERDLGFACQLSLIFYFVAGITGSETYNDIVFCLLAIIAIADHRLFYAKQKSKLPEAGASANPPGWRTA